MALSKLYVLQRRYFAKAKQSKSQSTLSQLKADKTTQQYSEILSWWNKIQTQRLDITTLPQEMQTDFIEKRKTYKESNIKRINKMNSNIQTSIKRKQEAINALPPRLSFICKISKDQKWKNDLAPSINKTYNNLNYNINFDINKINDMNISKIKHKEQFQIDAMENERTNIKSYKFSNLPLEHFPPLYDPNNISTQPSYVKSLIDYQWTPGLNIKSMKLTETDSDIETDKSAVYGQDYSQLQLSKIIKLDSISGSSNTIGGTQDLRKKLEQEEEANLTAQQKLEKERGKKTAEARAANSLRLEKIRQQKLKVRESVAKWDKDLKREKSSISWKDKEDEKDKKDEAATLQRIEEIELLNKELPNIESLLVDKELNKQFFENELPQILDNEFIDDEKYNQCVTLLRKYHTLQSHVGYKFN